MPKYSIAPFLLALALTLLFVGLLLNTWWLTGAAIAAVFLIALSWAWPSAALGQRAS